MKVHCNVSVRTKLLQHALSNPDRLKDWEWLKELSFFYEIIIDDGKIIIFDK